MTAKTADFYKILQVHPTAEPEVIEGAYKKLSKKYHPDRNKESGAEARMKQINQAYAVLGNTEQKKLYDREYHSPTADRKEKADQDEAEAVYQAREVLLQYFSGIAGGDLEAAYSLICAADKRNISREDFVEWQVLVSSTYEITEYALRHGHAVAGVKVGRTHYTEVYEFNVELVEQDKRNGQRRSEEFKRKVVRDGGCFKVFLGYKDLQKVTLRLKESFLEELEAEEPIYEKQRLIMEMSREKARAARYNRPFAIILLEAVNGSEFSLPSEESVYEEKMAEALLRIGKILRITDCFGRWSRNRLFILLPETRFFGAQKTAQKLFVALRDANGTSKTEKQLTLCAGVAQYREASLQEMVDLVVANTLKAKQQKAWSIVY